MTKMTFALIIALGFGCGPKVVRDPGTYTVEILAALLRQQEASAALHDAAREARVRGDYDACVMYAEPALLIDASAQAQAYRALWLADLPYPAGPDMEQHNKTQPDPGPSKAVEPPNTLCGEE